MSADVPSSGATPRPRPTGGRSVFRRIVFPVLVIAAIVAIIWWLEQRDDGGTSPTGESYGPVAMPVAPTVPDADVAAEEGALAPDFLLERLGEGELRLSDLRGRPVVVNFWATWCKPCRQEMPRLVEAYERYKGEGLEVVAVDLQEGRSIVGPFVEDFGIQFPVLIDRDGEVGDEYRLLGLPVTYFIDRDGVVRSVYTGPFQEKTNETNVQGAIEDSELERRIAEILAVPAGEAGR
jgi:cytochrome c biogenesis protein CcmG, thiol:disulfide interchange protein DsbE